MGKFSVVDFKSFCLFFVQKVIVLRFMDETGSVDCNQTAEQFYLQPVLGWLINRRHSRNPYLGSLVCWFVCLLVFIDLILRVDSREPA